MLIYAKARFIFICPIFSALVGSLFCGAVPAAKHRRKNYDRCRSSGWGRSLFLDERGAVGERSSYQISALFASPLSLEKTQKF